MTKKKPTQKKSGVKIPASFKKIRRKKTKAGRYYYFYTETKTKNKKQITKKVIVTKKKFEREQQLKQRFKKHYGRFWRMKYNVAVKMLTREEKTVKKRELKISFETFKQILANRGYPYGSFAYFNYTIISEAEENYDRDIAFLKFDNKYYKINDHNIENIRMLITEVVEHYFEKLRELYTNDEINSPHAIFHKLDISGQGKGAIGANDIPKGMLFDLDLTSFNQAIDKKPTEVIKLYFKNYFGTIRTIKDIYFFLYEKTIKTGLYSKRKVKTKDKKTENKKTVKPTGKKPKKVQKQKNILQPKRARKNKVFKKHKS